MPGRRRPCGALGRFQRPDDDVLAGGEMQQGGVLGQLDRWARVQVDTRSGRLKRPGRVMDLGAVELALVLGIEAVALGEEMLERPGLCVVDASLRAVRRAERFAGIPAAVVKDLVAPSADRDVRAKV